MSVVDRREVPAVEPPTEGAAIGDPPTARALAGLRLPLVVLPAAALAFGVPAAVLAAAGMGGLLVAMLTIAALAFVIAAMVAVATSGFWLRPATRLLRTQPWREARVRVYRPTKGFPRAKLHVRTPDGAALGLLAPALPWAAQQVLARTGRVWLVGPDARGWVAIRSAGLALPLGPARVTAEDVSTGYEIGVEQQVPREAPLAAADAVLARAIAGPRRRSRTDLIAPSALLVFAAVAVVDLLRRGVRTDGVELFALVSLATLAILGLLLWRVGQVRHWVGVDRLLAAGPWTPTPVELAPDAHGSRRPTGRATLPDGSTAPVVFRRASRPLLANIAATGLMWTAGPARPGEDVAAGLPGYPFLGLVRVGP